MIDDLLHLLYPTLCSGCSQPLLQQEDVLCLKCKMCLPYTDHFSNETNALQERLAYSRLIDQGAAYLYYTKKSKTQHLLKAIKYKNKPKVAFYLGQEIGLRMQANKWRVDALIPVPLHKKKQKERGYNQSEELAKGIASIISVPVITDVLHRIHHSTTQTKKSKTERFSSVEKDYQLVDTGKLEFENLALIDDVITTGATILICAELIRRVYSGKLYALSGAFAISQ